MVMPFFYLQYWFHDIVRAEDFCAFFLSVSLYLMIRTLLADGRVENVRRMGLVLGGCFMALVMIKFNIAAMQATMLLVIAYCCFRSERSQTLPLLSWMTAGMAAIAFPFIIYLLLKGSFTAFLTEYFVNTIKTVETGDMQDVTYMQELSRNLGVPKALAMLLCLTLSGWLVSLRLPRLRYVPLLVALFSFAICTRHTLSHYYKLCSVFLIFLPIQFLSHAESRLRARHITIIAACILGWGIFENTRIGSHQYKLNRLAKDTHESAYQYFSNQIQGHHPTVLYLYGCDYGYGMQSDALPAGRYWTYQYGTTPEMEKLHVRPLVEGFAHYIVANDYYRCKKKGFTNQRICSYGYKMVCKATYYNHDGLFRENRIYKRWDIK